MRVVANVIERYVEVLTTFLHVVDNPPGEGREVAIPWPDRFIAMAIHAGLDEEGFRFGVIPGDLTALYRRIAAVTFGQPGREGDHDEGENGKLGFHVRRFLVANYHK